MTTNRKIAEGLVLENLGPDDAANCGGCELADVIEAALDAAEARGRTWQSEDCADTYAILDGIGAMTVGNPLLKPLYDESRRACYALCMCISEETSNRRMRGE